jgi:hypothetical protein
MKDGFAGRTLAAASERCRNSADSGFNRNFGVTIERGGEEWALTGMRVVRPG